MKRNKPKKTPRGRTIIKKLKGNTVLLPGGGRYKVGESIRYSGKGITPIKRKGEVGKVGYSIDDVPDIKDWKPEVGEVGQGMPEVGNGVGFEVGGVGAYMYKPSPDWKWEVTPEPPSAWASIRAACAGYARELWDAARWFVSLPFRSLPDVAGPPPTPTPAPAADTPAPEPDPLAVAPIKDEPGSPFAPHPVKLKTKPFPPIGSPARRKTKRRPRKD